MTPHVLNHLADLEKMRLIYKLKSVDRLNSVGGRKESSAEHSWSCLVLADFLLDAYNIPVDRLRVYELLLYHDLVEIEAGDTGLHPQMKATNKVELELAAAKSLRRQLPPALAEKYWACFEEFGAGATREAKLARAVDALDAIIHEMDYPADWVGWSTEFLREKKGKCFDDFPELKALFDQLLAWLERKGFFSRP